MKNPQSMGYSDNQFSNQAQKFGYADDDDGDDFNRPGSFNKVQNIGSGQKKDKRRLDDDDRM